jgi:hypothetical protein
MVPFLPTIWIDEIVLSLIRVQICTTIWGDDEI